MLMLGLKRVDSSFKASVMQGLIATSGLNAKGFFRNLRISLEKKKEKEKKKRYYVERL